MPIFCFNDPMEQALTQVLTDEQLPHIINQLDLCIEQGAEPIAAFDADNTLWNTDIGEIFFEYIINNKLVELPQNPWEHYMSLRNGNNPPEGYLWLAQIMKDVPLATVHKWSDSIVELNNPIPTFKAMHTLISHLQSKNVKTYVVTASVKWAVEGAASLYNIPREQVVGVTTTVENGKITDKQDGPITWKQGKVDGILQATNGRLPFFCAGNSSGDTFLLECATHHKLAVQTVNEDHMIYGSECELQKIASEKNWWQHDHRS